MASPLPHPDHPQEEKAYNVSHIEDLTDLKGARQAYVVEREQTLKEALTVNRKAVGWSVIISMTIIMEAYDTGLIGNFFAYPAFAKTYGEYHPELDKYVVSAPWQAGLSDGAICGVIIGGFANGWLSARYGYKKVVLGALFFMNMFIFIPFFAKSPQVLLPGQIL